jgi:ATP-binding cassette subfamily B protein
MRTDLTLWREFLGRCWRFSRSLTIIVYGCLFLNTVSFALVGLALREVVNGTVHDDLSAIVIGALGAALAFTVDLAIGEIGFTLRIHLVERVALSDIETEVLRTAAGVETIEHLERTDYLDRIGVIRGESWALIDSGWAAVESAALTVRLALTLIVLGSVTPYLLALVVFAAAPLWFERRGRHLIRDAEVAAAESRRMERHLLNLATEAASSKEIRVAGVGPQLVARQRAAWDEALRLRSRARLAASGWSAAGWAIFGLGFVGALALVVAETAGTASAVGDIVLAITVGSQLRLAVEQAVRRATDTGGSARLLTPFRWLREYAAQARANTGRGDTPPTVLQHGITIENLSFTYPQTDRPAVDGLSVHLPAGAVVAVVGEYGSGKTTLVKLLAKLYRPDSGTIRVDGADLADLDTASWRAGMSAAFQDFGRYRTSFAESVGLGDLARIDDERAVAAAVHAADADALVAKLPQGIATQLGKQFGGVELSEGQWQKVALARACMRAQPRLFLLDEPTASLDSPSEHAIFERYMERARTIAAATGAITVIVSHRFSTVAGADLILVLEHGRLVESGDHDALMARNGPYADLYGMQATAYAT